MNKQTRTEAGVMIDYDTDNIKDECVSCLLPINDQSEQKYITRGNYCTDCNAKLDREKRKKTEAELDAIRGIV